MSHVRVLTRVVTFRDKVAIKDKIKAFWTRVGHQDAGSRCCASCQCGSHHRKCYLVLRVKNYKNIWKVNKIIGELLIVKEPPDCSWAIFLDMSDLFPSIHKHTLLKGYRMVIWRLIDASIHDVNRQDHMNINQWHSKVSDHRQLASEIGYMSDDI